jgi:hypothetical protein
MDELNPPQQTLKNVQKIEQEGKKFIFFKIDISNGTYTRTGNNSKVKDDRND